MRVGPQANPRYASKGDAIHLIERVFGVARPVAASDIGVNENLLPHFNPPAHAEALEQVLVEQASANQSRIEGWNVAKIVVIEIEFQPGMRLHPHRKEVDAQPWTGCWHGWVATRIVCLQRIID